MRATITRCDLSTYRPEKIGHPDEGGIRVLVVKKVVPLAPRVIDTPAASILLLLHFLTFAQSVVVRTCVPTVLRRIVDVRKSV